MADAVQKPNRRREEILPKVFRPVPISSAQPLPMKNRITTLIQRMQGNIRQSTWMALKKLASWKCILQVFFSDLLEMTEKFKVC